MIGGGIFNFPIFTYDSSSIIDIADAVDFCLHGITQTLYKINGVAQTIYEINGSTIKEIKLDIVIRQGCDGC